MRMRLPIELASGSELILTVPTPHGAHRISLGLDEALALARHLIAGVEDARRRAATLDQPCRVWEIYDDLPSPIMRGGHRG